MVLMTTSIPSVSSEVKEDSDGELRTDEKGLKYWYSFKDKSEKKVEVSEVEEKPEVEVEEKPKSKLSFKRSKK